MIRSNSDLTTCFSTYIYGYTDISTREKLQIDEPTALLYSKPQRMNDQILSYVCVQQLCIYTVSSLVHPIDRTYRHRHSQIYKIR